MESGRNLQIGRRRVGRKVREVERRPAAAHVVMEEDVHLLAEVLRTQCDTGQVADEEDTVVNTCQYVVCVLHVFSGVCWDSNSQTGASLQAKQS
jgi:hypothetical protein